MEISSASILRELIRRPHPRCSVLYTTLLLILLSHHGDARRLMMTTELAGAPAPDSSVTFLFPPFLEKPTTSSATPPNPPYCILPPFLSLPPPYIQTPPPPPFYFAPMNPSLTTIPSPPEPVPNPPPPPETIPNPPPTIYVPNPPETVPNPPSGFVPNPPMIFPNPPNSNYLPVFQPPVVYPPPSVPPPLPSGPAGLWCVAKPAVPDPIIQEAMDYACGSGSDCASIQDAGPCFSPNTLLNHASYAFNSFWQRTKVAGGTCDFGGVAAIISQDPSYDGCSFIYTQL